MEDIAKIKQEQVEIISKSCGYIEKYSNTLKIIAQNLDKISHEISTHVAEGDLTNQELNRKIWHDLNNIEHHFKQFTSYMEGSVGEYKDASAKLIDILRAARPKG